MVIKTVKELKTFLEQFPDNTKLVHYHYDDFGIHNHGHSYKEPRFSYDYKMEKYNAVDQEYTADKRTKKVLIIS